MRGTITKRPTVGGRARWAYIFDLGKDETGKRRQVMKSGFETKRDAEEALAKTLAQHREQQAHKTQATEAISTLDSRPVGEYFAYWLDQHAQTRCAPKTVERYRELARYLNRFIGDICLQDLKTAKIQETIHRLSESGGLATKEFPKGRPLAAKTVRHMGTLLHTMLADAVRLDHLPVNPMAGKRVILPKLRKKKPEVLDMEKLGILLDRARGTRLFPFLALAAATGCRRGELLALQWSDINFETGAVDVCKSLEQTKTGLRVKPTKSDEPRTFGIDGDTLDVLGVHRRDQERDKSIFGTGYQDNKLVFCQPGGQYYSPDRVGARVAELMRKAGLSGVSLHSLRHSHASELLSRGVPLAAVSERLGHANQAITLSIYSHALPVDMKAAANIWRDALAKVVEAGRGTRKPPVLANVSKKAVND
jgi:integrase